MEVVAGLETERCKWEEVQEVEAGTQSEVWRWLAVGWLGRRVEGGKAGEQE